MHRRSGRDSYRDGEKDEERERDRDRDRDREGRSSSRFSCDVEKLRFVETIARLVSEKGLEMEKTLMALNTDDNGNKFSFLRRSDPCHAFYQHKLSGYHHLKPKNKDEAQPPPDAHDCVADDDCGKRSLFPSPPTYWNLSFAKKPASITLKELGIIKLTAQFVARYDMCFLRGLEEIVAKKKLPQFEFLKPTDSRFAFFDGLVRCYSSVLRPHREYLIRAQICEPPFFEVFFHRLQLEKLEEGDEMAMIDLHAFVSGVDTFAHADDWDFFAAMPSPAPLSVMMKRCTEMHPPPLGSNLTDEPDSLRGEILACKFLLKGIPLKELGIIKLTAQFVARYGTAFRLDLMERVVTNPLFEFLRRTFCIRSMLFDLLVDAYAKVLRLSQKLWKIDVGGLPDTFLEFFSRCLQLEKLEDSVEMATVDLLALVSGVDCFAHIDSEVYSTSMLPPERLSTIMSRLGPQLNEYLEAQKLDCVAGDAQPDLWRHLRLGGRFRLPPKGITLRELGIIMLTAQFAARFGVYFELSLISRVVMNTQFEFLKVDDKRKNFYGGIVDAYDLVLRRCKKLKKGDARTATVLGFFFNLVQSKGLHAFVDVVDCFAQVDDEEYSLIMPAPVHLLMDMIPPTLRLPGTLVLPPVRFPCVAHLKPQRYREVPPLSPDDLGSGSPDGWFPWKETFIKVMAQFEARYGFGFRQALATRVAEKRLFEFMEQADSRSLSEFIESSVVGCS